MQTAHPEPALLSPLLPTKPNIMGRGVKSDNGSAMS